MALAKKLEIKLSPWHSFLLIPWLFTPALSRHSSHDDDKTCSFCASFQIALCHSCARVALTRDSEQGRNEVISPFDKSNNNGNFKKAFSFVKGKS